MKPLKFLLCLFSLVNQLTTHHIQITTLSPGTEGTIDHERDSDHARLTRRRKVRRG